ncbi:MAG: hypothetical protein K0S61_1142 [Anaerocolumna sp.]|jgi:capsular polysaccharide biosynthesis protein|nr:hypothetical protein [Anaerocolumna sp.]
MQQMNENYYEISLREIIEVLLKGRNMIVIITIVCILFSGALSFLILAPTYEAHTILMASPATDKLDSLQGSREDVAGILDSLATYPTMSLETYKEQIKNPHLLQQVLDELKLGQYEIDGNDLIKMIDLQTIKDTNLIAIKVTHKDSKLAADIANTLASKFTVFITNLSRQQASRSSQFLIGQLDIEKKKLDEVTLELKEFLSQPRGVKELEEEFDSKLLLLTDYKTQLVEKEVELNKVKAGLSVSEQELKNTPKVFVTKKSVGQDLLLNQILAEANGTTIIDAAQITMESEEVNEGYVELRTKVSDYRIVVSELSRELDMIKIKIDTTQKELEDIQRELADKDHSQTMIQRNVDLSQGTYDAFLNKYEEIRVAESTEIGDSTIIIVSPAVAPELPTGPRKVIIILIASVLGLMIGVFVVFFRHYWKTSEKQVVSEKVKGTL